MKLKKLFSFFFLVSLLLGQTKLDLFHQGKNLDFRAAPLTAPIRMGTLLPGSCGLGEFFFLTGTAEGGSLHACTGQSVWTEVKGALPGGGGTGYVLTSVGGETTWAPILGDIEGFPGTLAVTALRGQPVAAAPPQNGQALVWNGTAWTATTLNTAPGTLVLEANGVVVGTQGVHNILPGFGLLTSIVDTGTKLAVQNSVDSAVMLSRTAYQAGTELRCASGSNSGTAYSCSLSPELTAYPQDMVLNWKPDLSNTGSSVTLEIDGLGAREIRRRDGVTEPAEGEIRAGEIYPLWFDGIRFRMLGETSGLIPSGPAAPACTAAQRGKLWLTASGPGTGDLVSVCLKDENDNFAWRAIP